MSAERVTQHRSSAVAPIENDLNLIRRLRAGREIDRSPALLNSAALLTLGAAAIHFAVVPDHLSEYPVYGLFFIGLAIAQVGLAAAILLVPSRRLFLIGAAGAAAVIVLWLLSRTVGVPIAPVPWRPEAVGFPDVTATLLEGISVISSRISMRQGQGVKERMCRELGASIDIHGHRLFCFPAPEVLIELESFKGLFGRKVEYLNALGKAAMRGDLDTERLRVLPRDEALARLQRLKGVGEFGSQLVRLRALSAVDELPTAEPRLLGAVREQYGLAQEPDLAGLAKLAESWHPYRMWVAVSLRRTLAGGVGMIHSRAAG